MSAITTEASILVRRERAVMGRNHALYIFVDGQSIVDLNEGEQYTVPVSYGTHNVNIRTGRRQSASFCVTCSPVAPTTILAFKIDILGRVVLVQSVKDSIQSDNERKTNIYGMIAGLLAIIALFLPYYRIGGLGSFELIKTQDWVYFMTLAIGGVLASAFGVNFLCSLAGGLLLLLQYLKNQPLTEKADDVWTGLLMSTIQKEEGYYLLLISAIGLIVAGIVGFYQKRAQE